MEHTVFEVDQNGHDNLTDNDVASLSEAAEYLGVHPNTIRYRIKQGYYEGAKKILTVNGEAWIIPRASLKREEEAPQPPTTALSHPDNMQIMQETLTRVA